MSGFACFTVVPGLVCEAAGNDDGSVDAAVVVDGAGQVTPGFDVEPYLAMALPA